MANDYILKSSREDIVTAIKKTCCLIGEEEDAAEMILAYCPKQLYQNIDEIVQGYAPTEIFFEFVAGDNKIFRESLKDIYEDFYNNLPFIIILLGICYHFKDESGFMWLHDLCQLEQMRHLDKKLHC